MNFKPTIHFVKVVECQNTGEMHCNPFEYFPEFAGAGICLTHDLRYINLKLFKPDDWVILGGGGLFEVREDFQNIINWLLCRTYRTVAWGVGHNRHFGREINTEIDFNKFLYLSTRDYGYENQEYLPCVSCMNSNLDKNVKIVRDVGIIEHMEFPIDEFSYDKISNRCSIENMTDFIAGSNVIITNSYHACYWATLMEKKVILYKPFSTKFDKLEFLPVVYSGNLDSDIEKAKIYHGALESCRKKNLEFMKLIYNSIVRIG